MMKYLCFALCTILIPSAVACLHDDAAAAPMQEEITAEIAVVNEEESTTETVQAWTAPSMELSVDENATEEETVTESENQGSAGIELPKIPFSVLEEMQKG